LASCPDVSMSLCGEREWIGELYDKGEEAGIARLSE
jgi:hypothetical protein